MVILFLVKGLFNFEGANDVRYRQYFGDEVMGMIELDRKSVYSSDLIRSLIYVVLAAACIWFYIKGKLKQTLFAVLIGLFIVFDLVGVNLRYVSEDDFVSQRRMTEPFAISAADQQILNDTSIYRVYDPVEGINGARTSFFHHSIGGYHAAKPGGIQDLFDFHIYKNNIRVLNMLNVKYVLQEDEEGKSYPAINPNANGNAWFVDKLLQVKNADEEIRALDSLDVKNNAVVNTTTFRSLKRFDFDKDSTASVVLTEYTPNHLKYQSKNSNEGIIVFSEMYYPNGWNAYVDGTLTSHFKVNYVLRALQVSEGEHTIEFKFEPKVVETGSRITLASSIVIGLLVLGVIGYSFWQSRKNEEEV